MNICAMADRRKKHKMKLISYFKRTLAAVSYLNVDFSWYKKKTPAWIEYLAKVIQIR